MTEPIVTAASVGKGDLDTALYEIVVESHRVYVVLPFKHRRSWAYEALISWSPNGLLDPQSEIDKLLRQRKPYPGQLWGRRFSIASLPRWNATRSNEILAEVEPKPKSRWPDATIWLGSLLASQLKANLTKNKEKLGNLWESKVVKLGEPLATSGTRFGINDPIVETFDMDISKSIIFSLEPAFRERINTGIPANQVLNTDYSTKTKQRNPNLPKNCRLAVRLSRAAATRLKVSEPTLVGLRVENVIVAPSGTRSGQLIIELEFHPYCSDESNRDKISAGLLLEAIGSLGHHPNWQPYKQPDHDRKGIAKNGEILRLAENGFAPDHLESLGTETVKFSLMDFAFSLVAPFAKWKEISYSWDRPFIYTVAGLQLDDKQPENQKADLLRRVAHRFARRHNVAYADSENSDGVETVQPFETMCHAVAIEGGAVIVGAPKNVPFLKDFVSNNGPNIYLPIALAAHHEFITLLDFAQGATIPIEHRKPNEQTLKRLRALRDHLYNFRLAHRFSIISRISMHNLVFEAWRTAFRTERLIQDVNDDVLSAVAYLADAHRANIQKRWGWPAFVVSVGFAYGAASVLAASIILALRHASGCISDQDFQIEQLVIAINSRKPFPNYLPCAQHWADLSAYVPVLAGVILATLVGVFGFWQSRKLE